MNDTASSPLPKDELVTPARRLCSSSFVTKWTVDSVESSIPDRFCQQVLVHPNRTAVKVRDQRITYKMLDIAANRVAQAILCKSDRAQASVAILLGNDVQMFAALLGVLKAGKFYVALDPSYPSERNKYIANDVSADLIITNNQNVHLANRLVNDKSELINLDALDPNLPDKDPYVFTKADDIAFVHYTSGSTGQPKGVIYTHRFVLHIVLRYTNGQHISSADRLLLLSSYSYGASIGNIFSGLLNGAAICVFDIKEEGLDHLASWLIREEISIYYSVPTVFRHFAGGLTGAEEFPRLRLIRLGGETVYRSDVELYKKHFPESCLLHIGFGTTETGLVLECFLDKRSLWDMNLAPVGYAVEDIDVFLLDEKRAQVGVERSGEIGVRSRYISTGYWHRPELTEEAFLADLTDAHSSTYLTGDLGYMLEDGCLIHLGREDSQVKIRGFRVEATEVEILLSNLEMVTEAVVMTLENHNGEKRLAAYVVPKKGLTVNADQLRNALQKSLPRFMIPTAFVILDELPRTPSGKVDRKQLRHFKPASRQKRHAATQPRNSVETRLVQLWERILNVRPIGVREDFFALGGDSLAAVELFAQIEAAFGRSFSASTLLQATTIEQLARVIASESDEQSSFVPLRVTGTYPPFFCVHGIGGDIISFRALATCLGDEQPFYGLRACSDYATILSIEEIAERYLKGIQRLQPEGPYFVGGYSFGGIIALEIAQQLVAKGERVSVLAMFDTYGPDYPKLLPVAKRLAIHGRTLLRASSSERLQYLSERISINRIRLEKSLKKFSHRHSIALRKSIPHGRTKEVEAAHQKAVWDYVPRPYPGALHLFKAVEQKKIWHHDPYLGWNGLALGGIQLHESPGDHLSLLVEPNVAHLAEKLKHCLKDAHSTN